MLRVLLNTGRILLLATFLVATLGFTVYSHHCNSSGQTYSTLFEKNLSEEDPCHHESKIEISCCSMPIDCKSEQVKDKCCSNYEVFLRADILLNIPSDNLEIEIVDITLFETGFELTPPSDNLALALGIKQLSLPPPLSGAEIVILLNHQKVSPEHII